MAYTRSIFSHLLQWIPRLEFQKAVNAHQGDYRVRKLRTWTQFVALLFGQLTGHHSLRPIEAGMRSARQSFYHLGIDAEIHRSTLADANDSRDPDIYRDVFYQLLPKVQRAAPKHRFRFHGVLEAFDSTTISLCLELSPWARFHHGKGAVKLHTALDLAGNLPVVAVLTDARTHDVTVAKAQVFAPGTLLIIDKAYIDFAWFWELTQQGVGVVTRLKTNAVYTVVERREVSERNRTQGVCSDQIIRMRSPRGMRYEGKLRRISFRDPQTGHYLVFLTNRMDLSAKTICDLYKARWQIELFFKALKQNLQVKKFLGTSVKAVATQIWIALIAYLLVTLVKFQARLGWGIPAIMAALTVALFSCRSLASLWDVAPKERCSKQMLGQLSFSFS